MHGFIHLIAGLGLMLCLLISGCVSGPKPEDFFQPVSLEQRQVKTRIFETGDEVAIMQACASVLLDNGFQIFEAESRLGWISSGKIKSAPGQIPEPVSATILMHPVSGRPGATSVRLSFHGIDDADIYRDFFAAIAERLFQRGQG